MAHDAPRILAGRYEVGELIGRGGMAEVHIGHDARLGRTVAIKILRSDLARDPSFQARFRREAQSAAALNHPAIVAVYDTGEETYTEPSGAVSHVPFIVMEYVEGHTVRDILRDGHAVPIDEAVEIVSGVLSALEYSHQAGIVHRDIKPANVMLTPTGAVKVMDFGIARAVADSAATMTQTQAVIGTAQYLSPEQARGESVDARSDLYSTGCLLFELLTGRPPFTGDSRVAVAYQHVREAPQRPSAIAGDVPEVLDRIVLKALAKEREARYSTAAEFRSDLESAQHGGRVQAGPLGTVMAAAAASALPSLGEPTTQVMGGTDAATQAFAPVGAAAPVAPVTSGWEPTGLAAPADPRPGNGAVADKESRKRKTLLWTLITVAVVAVVAILAILYLPQDDDVKTVAVPTLTGKNAEEATAALTAVDLKIKKGTEASSVEEGLFTRSEPDAGAQVAPGSTVSVWFSSGPDAAQIPDVSGLDQDSARAKLTAAGFPSATSTESESGGQIDKDRVTRTDPAAGETLPKDTVVKIYLSDGTVEIPKLVGMTVDKAKAKIKEVAGTKISVDTRTQPDTADPGTVIDQSPSAGPVQHGQTITLTIAEEIPPAQLTIPSNLVGMTEAEARSALRAAGFPDVTIEAESSSEFVAGLVMGVSPRGGTTVDEGTVITLFVSKGPGPAPTNTTPPPPAGEPTGDEDAQQ